MPKGRNSFRFLGLRVQDSGFSVWVNDGNFLRRPIRDSG